MKMMPSECLFLTTCHDAFCAFEMLFSRFRTRIRTDKIEEEEVEEDEEEKIQKEIAELKMEELKDMKM